MRRLEVSARAECEIEELFLYGITHFGLRPADEYTRQLRKRLNQLVDTPFIGAERTNVRPHVRLLIFKAHNIFYRVTEQQVLIIRILHHSADWKSLL